MKYTNNWAKEVFEKEGKLKKLFFWGHQPLKDGSIGKSCFSQWFEKSFEYEGHQYLTAEHWMMAEKARLFNDTAILSKILISRKAGEVKKLGRKIKNFDGQIWNKNKFDIVVKGNYQKFKQHKDLATFLINTNDRIIIEASPYDTIWGIGMVATDAGVDNPTNWKGENLLGYALMEVRDLLRKE